MRQITLNFNSDNTAVYPSSDENAGHYQYRPYVIFYTGPENIDNKTDSDGVPVRHSQPLIVNLNADLNAIMYFPESPVIINGNGHKLTGSIIAKCFLQTVTSNEITNGSFLRDDGFNKPTPFTGNLIAMRDGYDNEIYLRPGKFATLPTANQVRAENSEYKEFMYARSGIIHFYSELNFTEKYVLLDYTKADHNEYAVTDADGKLNENKTFAAYVNATYKDKFKAFSGLDDSKIAAVSFPDENYNETAAIYYVAKTDLKDSDSDPNAAPKDDKCVKVLANFDIKYVDASNLLSEQNDQCVQVIADGATKYVDASNLLSEPQNAQCVKVLVNFETKYVDKAKLPYVKARTNQDYFYACVYDLKLAWNGNSVNHTEAYSGVRMINFNVDEAYITASYGTVQSKGIKTSNNEYKNVDSKATVSEADIYVNPNDKWCDSWGIEKNLLSTYKSQWKDSKFEFGKIEFGDNNDVKYMVLLKELNAAIKNIQSAYRSVTYHNETRYIGTDDTEYYMKVYNNANNRNNYVIVDNKGKILTKTITPQEVLSVQTKDDNDDKIANASDNASDNAAVNAYLNTYTRLPKRPAEIPGDDTDGDKENIVDDHYRGHTENRLNKDYRIPILERVYNSGVAFNLSTDSMYSYFQIPELRRANYTYMNVDEVNHTVNGEPVDENSRYHWKVEDMFFTTTRAYWID